MQTDLSAIVADDEPALREFLIGKLNIVCPEINNITEAENGIDACKMINEEKPDIAFLDIKMPGISGMDVANLSNEKTMIIFITAYDSFALEAFNNRAVDYILKPVCEERLIQTISRIKKIIVNEKRPLHLKWIKAQHGKTIRVIHVKDVIAFKAEDKYTSIYTAKDIFIIRTPIKSLAKQLDPEIFWHIHRNAIINAHFIKSANSSSTGKYIVKMELMDEPLIISRRYSHLFKQM